MPVPILQPATRGRPGETIHRWVDFDLHCCLYTFGSPDATIHKQIFILFITITLFCETCFLSHSSLQITEAVNI